MNVGEALEFLNDRLWYVALILIVCVGVWCTLRLRGMQFRMLPEMCRVTFSDREGREGGLSPFQVFCVSMGSRIGVGNITGPILAILVGGPGAILWMWVFALIGMATSFVETTIGQIYKGRDHEGNYHGGPAYSVSKALGMRRAGMIVAVVMMLMYIVGFVSMEMCSMSEAFCGAFDFEGNQLFFAILITLVAAAIMAGGVGRVAGISTKVVPLMAVAWIVVCIISIAFGAEGIVSAVVAIFEGFVNVPSVVGGGIGAMIMAGMRRGVLSNEAGVGTIPNISSMASTKHPAAQGFSQSLGVLIDTVVSTMTALVILSYADIGTLVSSEGESINILQAAFSDTVGGIAPYLVAAFLFVFAFTSMMSDFVIGENNLKYFSDRKGAVLRMRIAALIVVFVSSFVASDEMFVVVDIMLALCAFINTYLTIRLGGRAVEAFKDYVRKKDSGVEDPEFTGACLTDSSGVTEWD
ncbi:MAG: alanine/glycine:cation symporter family protein [Thermoplasmata archaeon]|nr:alanine/glycine:cation symporter family protein [Thermoplasmata archaeon]